MIKLTYAKLSQPSFIQSIQKLASMPTDTKTAYQLKKVIVALQSHKVKMGESFKKDILEVFTTKKEDGSYGEVATDKTEEYKKAEKAFGEREITVDRKQFTLGQLDGFKLSAQDLSALEPLIEDPENREPAQVLPMKG